jgi:hypothetical protein
MGREEAISVKRASLDPNVKRAALDPNFDGIMYQSIYNRSLLLGF